MGTQRTTMGKNQQRRLAQKAQQQKASAATPQRGPLAHRPISLLEIQAEEEAASKHLVEPRWGHSQGQREAHAWHGPTMAHASSSVAAPGPSHREARQQLPCAKQSPLGGVLESPCDITGVECAVCLENLGGDAAERTLPRGHRFHEHCAASW